MYLVMPASAGGATKEEEGYSDFGRGPPGGSAAGAQDLMILPHGRAPEERMNEECEWERAIRWVMCTVLLQCPVLFNLSYPSEERKRYGQTNPRWAIRRIVICSDPQVGVFMSGGVACV